MAGWDHQFNEHELRQTQGDGEGQGELACFSPGGHKDSDMTGQLNNKDYGQSEGNTQDRTGTGEDRREKHSKQRRHPESNIVLCFTKLKLKVFEQQKRQKM